MSGPGARLRDRLAELPDRPGVYQFRDADGGLLYVGKAKSLRSRVRSYFQRSAQHTPRTTAMVAEVDDLEIIVVDTELEALLLESNLIKQHHPRYNVILRDDKHYPYLKLSTGDEFPRLSLVRQARLDGHQYYGPFIPAAVARRTLKLVPKYFQVATCNEVFDGNRRPCLYYHLDQCLAPCAGKTTREEYGRAVQDARLFLEGRNHELERSLEARMTDASERLEFERAARYRDTLRTLRRVGERQHIASVGLEHQDYLAHHQEGDEAALQLFQMREGKVRGRREFGFRELEDDPGGLYAAVLTQYYLDAEPPPEIYVAAPPDDGALIERWLGERRGGRVRLKVPRRGVKARFLELVRKNAALAFESRFRSAHGHGVEAADELARVLDLDDPPARIECFDISNTQGTDSVASMVVWSGGKMRRSEYRSFHVRSVEGSDDFASIGEAVLRRYRRLLAENRRLPDLVLIDGGPGQLGAAVRSLAETGLPTLAVVALAKREEELWLHGAGRPIRLDRAAPALKLVQRIRDEAHRFAVARHRARRSRRTLRTELTDLPGIGPVTARKLLRTFGSLAGVRRAGLDDLERAVGRKAAAAVAEAYGNPETGPAD